jgi:NNP family nitrate/nitrite transporter-like MFS transporter
MGRRFALLGLRQSYLSTGTEMPAFWTFLVCHIGASTLTWVRYVRPQGARIPVPVSRQPTAGEPIKT